MTLTAETAVRRWIAAREAERWVRVERARLRAEERRTALVRALWLAGLVEVRS